MSDDDAVDTYERYATVLAGARRSVMDARDGLDALDLADGERYVAALVEGSMRFVHFDPARPVFVPWTTPERRWADNGRDSAYWIAPLDGRHRYRVHGVRGDECYLSFTVYAGSPGHPEKVARNINHLDLGAAPGTPYAVVLEPPDDACYVIARQYFLDPERERPASLAIEVLDGPPAVDDVARRGAGWRAATDFLVAMTRPRAAGAASPSWVSTVPNVMGQPAAWVQTDGGGRGTPDQIYSMGPFALDGDDALVVDLTFPSCAYAGAVLWNLFSQSIDARLHRSTINHREAVAGADGAVRVVVAARDPGVANWLDTGGRRRGSVYWRFLLAEHAPALHSQVVPVDHVPSLPRRS